MLHLLFVIHYPPLDPVAFHLGPARWGVAVRWYGLAYVVGLLAGYWILTRMIRAGALRLKGEQLSDLILWLAVGLMAGGRLGWWLFYHRATGSPEPWYEPIAAWHGGMSFHGAVLGIVLTALIWSRSVRAPFWNLIDCMALVAPIGLFLGRIANFINAELVGRPSSLPWAVIFPGEMIGRHPSQLYEAMLEGPMLMALLWMIYTRGRQQREGAIAASFLIFYGIFRFCVEFTREPDPQLGFIAFGWLTMGQLLSVALSLTGFGVLLYTQRRQALKD